MDIMNLLTIADFCQTMGISRSTWHKLSRAGETPATIKIGGSIRISRNAVEEWLSENEARQSADKAQEASEGPDPLHV